MKSVLSALYGLKHNPFSADVPTEALRISASVERFCWRMEQLVGEGGFAMMTGDLGTGAAPPASSPRGHARRDRRRPGAPSESCHGFLLYLELFDVPRPAPRRAAGRRSA